MFSIGIVNYGEATLNNCYVMGVQSGVGNRGKLEINGGTYEGYAQGGVYFSGTVGGQPIPAYVCDAIIRQCAMPAGYTATEGAMHSGFVIGDADDITVYMDNCDIYGSSRAIVMVNFNGRKRNSLYISNSKINVDEGNNTNPKIRIDDDTFTVYKGKGSEFTANDANLLDRVKDRPNDVYRK